MEGQPAQEKKLNRAILIVIIIIVVLGGAGYWAYSYFNNQTEITTDTSRSITTDLLAGIRGSSVILLDMSGEEVVEKSIYTIDNDRNSNYFSVMSGTKKVIWDGTYLYVVYGSGIDKITLKGELISQWSRPFTKNEKNSSDYKKIQEEETSMLDRGQIKLASTKPMAQASGLYFISRDAQLSAAELHNDYLFISANGAFIVLNKSLEVINSVNLELDKNADDILIYKQWALLVDNIWEPYYIISIDISNPEDPRGVAWLGSGDANTGLGDQWIDNNGNWHVFGSYVVMGGSGAWIAHFKENTYTDDKPYTSVSFDGIENDHDFNDVTTIFSEGNYFEESPKESYYIMADLDQENDYFLVYDASKEERVVMLSHLTSSYKLKNPISLGTNEDYWGSSELIRDGDELIALVGQHIFILEEKGDSLIITRDHITNKENRLYDIEVIN